MPDIHLNAFTVAQIGKLDAYLVAAITNVFADYEVGDRANPRIPIGFTVRTGYSGSEILINAVLAALFATPLSGRLTIAHGPVVAPNTSYFFTADVSWLTLFALIVAPFVTEVQLGADLAPRRPVPRRTTRATADSSSMASPPRTDKTQILGLIDHGCPFAHRAYLSTTGTRIFSLWDQDPVPDFPTVDGTLPRGYDYGRQLDRAALNRFIGAATVNTRIDEDLCYELAHYPAVKCQHTHGSIVMGLLASQWQSPSLSRSGRSEPNQDAMEADFVFVQLPRAVPLAPNRGGVERSTLDGLRYILDCAPDHAIVSVVVDYGTELGPHDGTSWFERALDAMVAQARLRAINLRVVFPSGNGHEDVRNAVVFPLPGPLPGPPASARFGWWLPMGSGAPTPLELWVGDATASFTLHITAPAGSGPIPDIVVRTGGPNEVVVWPAAPALPCCIVVSKRVISPSGQAQRQILVHLSPTSSDHLKASAPPGVWMLEFVHQHGYPVVGPIYAYAAWGGRNPGMSQRVHASRFIAFGNQPNVRFSGDGSLLGSACGDEPVMVGSYEKWHYFARAVYSGGGLARGGSRSTPPGADWLAVTEQSPVLGGLLCLGTRSASVVRVRGTSLATPQVARKIIAVGPAPLPKLPTPVPSNAGTVKHEKVRAEYAEPRLA